MSILQIKDLSIVYKGKETVDIVSNVSFSIERKSVTCLVGASGSGKSMSAYSILGLLPQAVEQTRGSFIFNEKIITKENINDLRAKKIGMIFQEPFSALNPVIKVGKQIEEIFQVHDNKGKKENAFKTKESTKILVGKILSGFRTFMKDEQRIHEMILEMKSLKTSKD
jgi:peptide/nickel transport system ATP-binding protein